MNEVALAYLPGNATRVKVKAVGSLKADFGKTHGNTAVPMETTQMADEETGEGC